MPATVFHSLTATTPDDPAFEIRPSHWNSDHVASISAVGSEISGAFSNGGNVAFALETNGRITASANVTAAPSPVNVTGANGSSVNAQTIAFSNSNGLSLGVSTAANGATITGSYTVPSTAGLISAVNVSAGTTSNNLSAVTLSNSNGVSFGLNGSVVTASHDGLTTAAQSNHSHGFSADGGSSAFQTLSFSNGGGVSWTNTNGQVGATVATTYRASNDAVGLNTAQSNVTWTVNSSGLSLDARGYAGTGTSATNASVTLNSNGLAVSVAAPGAATLTVSAVGNTTVNSSGTWANAVSLRAYGVLSAGTSNGSLLLSTPDAVDYTYLSVGASNLGNTAGDTGMASQRLVFVGSNNITLSGSTNGGSATLSFIGGAGGGGGVGLGVSNLGNTAGTTGTVTTGNVVLVGSGPISLSQSSSGSNATISINAPATSSLSATGNASLSTNGSTISLGANAAAVTLGGNSTSAGAGYSNVSTGTLFLAGGNNITLSQNGASVTISGANAGGAQTGISGIIASDATYTSGSVYYSNQNGVTIGSSVDGASQYVRLSVATSYAASNHSHGNPTLALTNLSGTTDSNSAGFTLSLSAANPGGAGFSAGVSGGNTAGDTGATGTRVVFAGGNNVTLSQATDANGATITVSGANVGGAQTGISGIQVSNTTYTSGTVTFQNANGISWGSSGAGGISASYTVPSTAGLLSAVNVSAGTTSNNLSALTFGNGNGVSFGLNASTVTASVSQSVQTQASGDIARSGFTSAGNNIGLSGTLNSGGLSLSATVAAQTNQTVGGYFVGNTTGQSSSSTVDARSLSFDGAGIVSAGWSAGSIRISATQSNQAFSAGAASSAFQTLSFQDSNGVSFSNNAGAIRVTHGLAGTATAITGAASMTVNSGGISFNGSNLAGVGTTFNGANISGSMTVNSVGVNLSMSVAAPGAAAESNWVNLLGANTSGNTSASGSTIGYSGINLTLSGTNNSQVVISAPATSSLVGAGGISLSTNGSTITVSYTGGGGGIAAGVSTVGNTAGNTGTGSSGTMYFAGSNSMTLSQQTAAGATTVHFQPLMWALSGGAGISLSTNGNTIVIYTV